LLKIKQAKGIFLVRANHKRGVNLVNLKKILICALALTVTAGSSYVNAATEPFKDSDVEIVDDADDSNESAVINSNTTDKAQTHDRTQQRLNQRNRFQHRKPGTNYQKARFVKLTSDETYNYYLDLESVTWKRVPYTSSEYMADVWIRMVERIPSENSYNDDYESIELVSAREQNISYDPGDVEVLNRKQYVLEHYYLRPARKQIQFLCELEVVGHPQNTEAGRAYDVKNWEDLIPGSIESIIYKKVLATIGTWKATDMGHETFVDFFEEYTRISIR